MFESGYWTIGRVRGVPIRLHWSVPLGALFFSGFRFAPVFWIAFFGLILAHELGHAWVVQRLGHRALFVDVLGFGGLCHWDGRRATPLHEALVAWGGVAAQFVLLLATLLWTLLAGPPRSLWQAELSSVFINTNLWIIALNLLPLPALDGGKAWTLFRELKRQGYSLGSLARRRSKPTRKRPRGGTGASSSAAPSTSDAQQKARQELAKVLERVAKEAGDNTRKSH